jgi:flagellar motor switch protein FliN
MIADELSQDDIDALLGGLGDDGGGDDAGDALSALSDDSFGDDAGGMETAAPESAPAAAPSQDTVDLPEFSGAEDIAPNQEINALLSNVDLNVKIRLGKTEMLIEDILKLQAGRVVQLDALSGDPVDVLVNNKVVAKGEVIILNEAFCVRLSEIYDIKEKLIKQS